MTKMKKKNIVHVIIYVIYVWGENRVLKIAFLFLMFYFASIFLLSGSATELKYILQTFGIPGSFIPVTSEGEVTVDSETSKWKKRRQAERLAKSTNDDGVGTDKEKGNNNLAGLIGTPGNHDVLLGRGRLSQDHIGNVRFRYLIDEHQARYDQALKKDKTAISEEIVQLVRAGGGRFIKESGSGWIQVDETTARNKVSTCFRTTRCRKKRTQDGGPNPPMAASSSMSSPIKSAAFPPFPRAVPINQTQPTIAALPFPINMNGIMTQLPMTTPVGMTSTATTPARTPSPYFDVQYSTGGVGVSVCDDDLTTGSISSTSTYYSTSTESATKRNYHQDDFDMYHPPTSKMKRTMFSTSR